MLNTEQKKKPDIFYMADQCAGEGGLSFTLIGEVRAICRFLVFDRNGLSGNQLIDSCRFEKNPPTESG